MSIYMPTTLYYNFTNKKTKITKNVLNKKAFANAVIALQSVGIPATFYSIYISKLATLH